MTELVFRYLKNNYEINLESYTNLTIQDKYDEKQVRVEWLKYEVKGLYGLSEDEIEDIFGLWLNNEILKFENKIVDIQYEMYAKTGVQMDLSNMEWGNEFNSSVVGTIADLDDTTIEEVEGGLMEYVRRNNTTNYNG